MLPPILILLIPTPVASAPPHEGVYPCRTPGIRQTPGFTRK